MVKKRSSSRRRVTNINLAQIVADNHTETVERLARIEATIVGLPEKVEKLEAHRNWLAGVIAVLTSTFAYIVHKGH